MSHQVLALHRVSPRCYDLSGVQPGSIRDQLLRSTSVVHALLNQNAIGPGFPLLVYGAGPAGINAAMLAALCHVDVTVVEQDQRLFKTIAAAWRRRVDPCEYDWPHAHWTCSTFPASGRIPLPQTKAMCGADLAAAFKLQWEDFLITDNGSGRNGTVTLVKGVVATTLTELDDPADLFLKVTGPLEAGSPTVHTKQFGARIACMGQGEELVAEWPLLGRWNGYRGPAFWTDSDGIDANRPLPAGVGSIIISGAGDGGMQDFQRVATSCFGRQLFQRLESAARSCPSPEADVLPTDTMIKKFLSAEEKARRACGWATSAAAVSRVFKEWHAGFKKPVEDMVDGWSTAVAQHVAQCLFRPEMFGAKPQPDITWVMREQTPGSAYALNRYLSLLLCALAERFWPEQIRIYPASSIESISAQDHACKHAAACVGRKHLVKIDTGGTRPVSRTAELIIIRHGIENRRPLRGAPVPVPLQMPPFDLP